MFPVPVIFALLRILKRRPPEPEDEDVLFDEFATLGEDQALTRACSQLGVERGPTSRRHWRGALEWCLVDMLRQHKRNRDEQREWA